VNAALGRAGVLLGLLACLAGAGVLASGLARRRPSDLKQGGTYAWLALAGAALAALAMERALVTHDFSLAYVAQNNSRDTPLLFTLTGMWSALEGSILLWTLVLAAYGAAVATRYRQRRSDPVVGWALLVIYAVAAFFFSLMLGPADPFRHVAGAVPADGAGPNPLLQDHPLVAVHPPLLYAGFVGLTVPFAFAVGSLVTGRLGGEWSAHARRWALLAWGLLTAGIVLGAWWSYQVLGWGGFWAWDPVENASLLPWLCATAYLHSTMAEERRGLLRVWNLSLCVSAFALTILGTFLTRSGVVESVHSFTQSAIGPLLLGAFGAVVACGIGLVAWRGDALRSPGGVDSPVSREGAILANNVVFAGFALVVLLGTVFPLLVEAVSGQQLSVGRPYFDQMTRPLGLALLFLMAVAPALPWRKASAELAGSRLAVPAWAGGLTVAGCSLAGVRGLADLVAFGLAAFAGTSALGHLWRSARSAWRRGAGLAALAGRSTGGMVVHLGVVVVAVGLAASLSYGHRAELALRPGQSGRVAGHQLTYLGSYRLSAPNRQEVVERVRLDGSRVLGPAVSSFRGDTEGVGTPAVASGPTADVYLTVDSGPGDPSGVAVIGVVVQPLVMWLWIGGALMALGTLLALVPAARRPGRAGPPSGLDGGVLEPLRERAPEPVA